MRGAPIWGEIQEGGDLTMHQCPVCPKSFPSPYKLQRHYVIHTGQKPFICSICGKAFTQSDHLKTHLQKVHPSGLLTGPTDQQDGILTHNKHPNCDKAAERISIHGGGNHTSTPFNVSSSVASQPGWKMETVTYNLFLPSSETENPPKNMPCVNDDSASQNRFLNVMDAIPQEQADSADEDTSVCNINNGYTCKVCSKSFTSSLQLWIHSPTHNKSKQSGQTFSKHAYANSHLQSQEMSSKESKTALKHQCPKCLKTFCSPSKLQRHFLIHTGQKPYSCTICRKTFRQKVHLKYHLSNPNKCSLSASTEKTKQKFCDSGNSDMKPQSSLQRPTSQHTLVNSSVELELQCKIRVNGVQELNKTEIKLDAGIKQEQPFNTTSQCWSLCQKSDEQEQQYAKPFRCTICNRSFRQEVNLIRHHKIHRKQKEVGSPTTAQNSNNLRMCYSDAIKHSPEASRADQLDLNIIVKPESWSGNSSDHSGSFPQELIPSAEQQRGTLQTTSEQQRISSLNQCHACLKCFPSISKLKRHVMTHTGQRPFGCEICGKRFRQKTHLRVHCRTHLWSRYHKQRSLYINRPPSSMNGLNARTAAEIPLQEMFVHKKDFETHSGSNVVSVKPPNQTPSVVIIQNGNRESERLMPHISKKNEVVRKVPKVTVKRTHIAKAKQNPGNAQHKCFQCLKCFPSASKLQRHEMVHTGLKPFQCVLCGKAFRQAPHLKTHERTHCERKEPVDQRGNNKKVKVQSQQQLYPRISVRIPQQKKSVIADSTLSNSDCADGNGVSAQVHSRHETPNTKVNSLFKTNFKSNITFKKRKLHTCRICFKNFAAPYKLSRHMVTHSGIRPYKCTVCSRTYTQRGHLKDHELKCRQGNRTSDGIQGEMMKTNQLRDKCLKNILDFNVDAAREQPETHHTSVGRYSLADGDLSFCSEAARAEWLDAPEAEKTELEKMQRDNCNQATDNYSYSFPSELAFEINKLQKQNMAASHLSHQFEGSAHNVALTREPKGVMAISDNNQLPSDDFLTSVVENQMQPDNSWCEPLTLFECDKCAESFNSENDLKRHICSSNTQPKMTAQKNCCNICSKHFVTPSKLKRHFLIHTGQRPFRCDICGKTFTQSAHVRTHRLIH
ncbi:zinc finger protein Xfin-like [Plectropomus leopardus]|uniref:zinc finger protein Xfin-like n=1 Tax=Plectropomus leopardus TaxID=160734 RepID=UPI001C4B874B|nr:zinc finger protein Xfin-like [Plectropomus leopardus]